MKETVMRISGKLFMAALIAGAAGCGGSTAYSTTPGGGGTPVPNTIDANPSLAFLPPTLTVATGTTVTWTFEGVTHNVTFTAASGVPADIPNSTNASVQRTFATAGTFAFHCTIHPQMTGTITVQ
jgi:plastocyanin